jgi:hypothetical protein
MFRKEKNTNETLLSSGLRLGDNLFFVVSIVTLMRDKNSTFFHLLRKGGAKNSGKKLNHPFRIFAPLFSKKWIKKWKESHL